MKPSRQLSWNTNPFFLRNPAVILAIVLLIMIAVGVGVYLLQTRTAYPAPLEGERTYHDRKGRWMVNYPVRSLLPPKEYQHDDIVWFRGKRTTGEEPVIQYWGISVHISELTSDDSQLNIADLALKVNSNLSHPAIEPDPPLQRANMEVITFHSGIGWHGSVHTFFKKGRILIEVSTEPDPTRSFIGVSGYGEPGLHEEMKETYLLFINNLVIR